MCEGQMKKNMKEEESKLDHTWEAEAAQFLLRLPFTEILFQVVRSAKMLIR